MPQWTPQQNNAITARNRNILVSAAAGSGKTAVLVERVKQMICNKDNPVDIDKLLIVTFTNAAAAEMRYRISKSLSEYIKNNPGDSFYKRQLSLIPNAKICTIDSFCVNLVKENFFDLSINQDFSTLEESELQLLEDSIISDVLDEYYEENDKNFISLAESFTAPGNEKPLINAIKKILRFIYAQPFPYNWLNNALEQYNPNIAFEDTVWFKYIKNEIESLLNLSEELIAENISLVDFDTEDINNKFIDVFEDDLSVLSGIRDAYKKSWNELLNIDAVKFKTMPRTTKIDSIVAAKLKNNRENYKTILTKDIPSFFVSTTQEYAEDMESLYPKFSMLIRLIKDVDERLMAEKKERNSYSFSDIEHFAINLLFSLDEESGEIIRSNLAKNLSENFYEILVDEYQDTNEAQDLLFTYLSNGKNLFTVGDIKQSIYRFRLAMPDIFNKKKKTYSLYNESDNNTSSKIILDKNFRSRKDICSFVNFIFSNIMSSELGEVDYNSEEYLNCGADYNNTTLPSADIRILNGVKGEDADKKEAVYIAKIIKQKVKSGELIKDGDTYRPVKYGDFAILMRSLKNHINDYSQVLTDYGIPIICDNSTNLFENSEVRMLMSLLRTIDNPMQDIPLLATLMSPFYGFTADELAQIKINANTKDLYFCIFNSDNQKVKDFIKDRAELRKLSVTMSVAGFIRYIVESKGMIAFINAMGNSEQRYQNILKLISFASKFDSGVNVGLTAFIRYIDKIVSSDKSVDSASLTSGSTDAVTIMSVHHSKGLEFPICILAGASRQYNKQDLSDKLLLNTNLGLGLKCHNEELMYQYNSIPYAVIKSKNTTELMSENLRVLYVAMTRAKEQFITFITCDNIDRKAKKLSAGIVNGKILPYTCRKIQCDADFFLICTLIHPNGQKLRALADCDYVSYDFDFPLNLEISDEIEVVKQTEESIQAESDEKIISQIKEKLDFSYRRKQLEGLSTKLTASMLDSSEQGFAYITSSKPSYMNKHELTPAQRGTAMHAFMQYCDYSNAKNNLKNEIERMADMGYISKEQADALDTERLHKFFSSNFAGRMFSSNKIHREIKVSSFVKANEIYDTEYEDAVLIQGIADCVFEEDDGLVLVDYKTDRIKDEEELLSRYEKQIMFYKNAVSKTLKKNVKSAVLYSFYLNKVCAYK